MTTKKEDPVGRAYGFFYCNASQPTVERELPKIRKLVKAPSPLELSLTGTKDLKPGDPRLDALAQEADRAGITYSLKATYPGQPNKTAADEAAAVLNQAYQTPLYKPNEPFKGEIVYQEKGRPVFRA